MTYTVYHNDRNSKSSGLKEYPSQISIPAKAKEIRKNLEKVFSIEKNRLNGVVYRFDALVSSQKQKFNSHVLLQLEEHFPDYVFSYLGENRVYIIERIALEDERGSKHGGTDQEKELKHKNYAIRI